MLEKLFKLIATEDEMQIRDPISLDVTQFRNPNGYTSYRINIHEAKKPYLVARKFYGSDEYEDLLLWLNNIPDQFHLEPEAELLIFDKSDVDQFILDNSQTV